MQNKILAISDNNAGHLSQINGVLKELKIESHLLKLDNSFLGKLPLGFLPLGVKAKDKNLIKDLITANNFKAIIVVGRRNLSVALYIKRLLKNKVKLIFIMPPGDFYSIKEIDLVFMHSYKKKPNKVYSNKVKFIDFSPSFIDEKYKNSFSFKKGVFYIAVIIGGSAKGANFSKEVAGNFANVLEELCKKNNAKLLITTSRRTQVEVAKIIEDKLKKYCDFFWHYNKNEANPYYDILKRANAFVVSGESTSMISEICQEKSKAPLLIYDDERFIKRKLYKNFHKFLYNLNYAKELNNTILNKYENDCLHSLQTRKIENSTKLIALEIGCFINKD